MLTGFLTVFAAFLAARELLLQAAQLALRLDIVTGVSDLFARGEGDQVFETEVYAGDAGAGCLLWDVLADEADVELPRRCHGQRAGGGLGRQVSAPENLQLTQASADREGLVLQGERGLRQADALVVAFRLEAGFAALGEFAVEEAAVGAAQVQGGLLVGYGGVVRHPRMLGFQSGYLGAEVVAVGAGSLMVSVRLCGFSGCVDLVGLFGLRQQVVPQEAVGAEESQEVLVLLGRGVESVLVALF